MKKTKTAFALAVACMMALCLGLAACSGGGGAASGSSAASAQATDNSFPGTWAMTLSENSSGVAMSEQDLAMFRETDPKSFWLELNEDGTGLYTYMDNDVVELTWKQTSETTANVTLSRELFSLAKGECDMTIEGGNLVMTDGSFKMTFEKLSPEEAASASTESASAASSQAGASAAADGRPNMAGSQSFKDVYETSDGKVYMDAVMEFVNDTNQTVLVQDVWFEFLDGQDNSLAIPHGVYISPAYAAPGESAYIYPSTSQELPSGTSANEEYFVSVDFSTPATDKTVVEYPLSDVLMYEESGYPCTGCKVTNNTKTDSGEITVVVTYFDKSGQLLGVSEETIPNLEPGQSATAVILDSTLQHRCAYDAVDRYEVHATALV